MPICLSIVITRLRMMPSIPARERSGVNTVLPRRQNRFALTLLPEIPGCSRPTFDPAARLGSRFQHHLFEAPQRLEARQHGASPSGLLTDQGRDAVLLPARIMLR